MKLNDLENLFRPYPPLCGTWVAYRCQDCGHDFRIDNRVLRISAPTKPCKNRCPQCSSEAIQTVGIMLG